MKRVLLFAVVGIGAIALAFLVLPKPDTGRRTKTPPVVAAAPPPAATPRPAVGVRPTPRAAPSERAVADEDASSPRHPPAPDNPAHEARVERTLATPGGQAMVKATASWAAVSSALRTMDIPDAELLATESKRLTEDLKAWRENPDLMPYDMLEGRQLGLIQHIRQASNGNPDLERSLGPVEQMLHQARAEGLGNPAEPLPEPSQQYRGLP